MQTTLSARLIPPLARLGGTYGNMLLFLAAPTAYMQSLYTNFGEVVPIGYRPSNVFAFGPTHNQEILTNADLFQNHSYDDISYIAHSQEYARELTAGLGFLNGEAHRERRRLLRPSFLKESVNQYTSTLVELTEKFIADWHQRDTIEIYAECEDLVMNMGLHTLLGLEASATADRVKDLFEEVFALMFSASYALFPYDLPGTPYRRAGIATRQLSQAINKLIEQKKAAGAQGDDVLSQLVRLHQENPAFTLTDLVGTTAGLFRGMYPNVASSLVSTLLMLSLHPQIAEQVLQELHNQLHGSPPTSEDLEHLPLLEGVIMETLRLLPPAYWLIRIARAPFELGGYHFPTGSNVFLSAYVTHRLPEIYPDPEVFNPQRWIGTHHQPYAFIPFSAGARRCLGSTYALNLNKIVIATILQRYSLSLRPHSRLDFYGLRRPIPRPGTRLQIGPAGVPNLPVDLGGNFRQFIQLPQ